METYKAKGKVVAVGEVKTFSSGFTKRDLVVDVSSNPAYKSPVPFTLKKEKTALADALGEGDEVAVEFTVDGRAWDSGAGVRYLVDVTAWSVERLSAAAYPHTAQGAWDAWCKLRDPNDTKGERFSAFVAQICPAIGEIVKSKGLKLREVATEEDWARIIDALTGAGADETPADDPSDLPF